MAVPSAFSAKSGNPVSPVCRETIGAGNRSGSRRTSASGSAQFGEGTGTANFGIPNNPSLRGAKLQTQVALLDLQNGRRTPVTVTNSLEFVIQ